MSKYNVHVVAVASRCRIVHLADTVITRAVEMGGKNLGFLKVFFYKKPKTLKSPNFKFLKVFFRKDRF